MDLFDFTVKPEDGLEFYWSGERRTLQTICVHMRMLWWMNLRAMDIHPLWLHHPTTLLTTTLTTTFGNMNIRYGLRFFAIRFLLYTTEHSQIWDPTWISRHGSVEAGLPMLLIGHESCIMHHDGRDRVYDTTGTSHLTRTILTGISGGRLKLQFQKASSSTQQL